MTTSSNKELAKELPLDGETIVVRESVRQRLKTLAITLDTLALSTEGSDSLSRHCMSCGSNTPHWGGGESLGCMYCGSTERNS